MKSMLGQDVFRAHSTEGILTRGFICFIASIIRCEISNACKALGMKPALMLPQVERPMLAFMANGTYKYIANTKEAVNDLFAYVGVTEEDFETIAADVNERCYFTDYLRQKLQIILGGFVACNVQFSESRR